MEVLPHWTNQRLSLLEQEWVCSVLFRMKMFPTGVLSRMGVVVMIVGNTIFAEEVTGND